MIKIVGSRVCVKVGEAEERTAGGIIIPDTKRGADENNEGVVVAVGYGWADEKKTELNIKVGDKVYFSATGAYELPTENETSKYYVIDYDNILGVVEGKQ